MRNLIVNGELVLYGPVGGDWWDESGFTATEVLASLAELDGDVTVRLNSGGGIVWDGVAIYNALRAQTNRVTIVIDGVAASSASVIAMAGDEIIMRTGAVLMIHNASAVTFGNAADHEKNMAMLRKLDGQMAGIYAERTGLPVEEIRALMDAETWMTDSEAVDLGFAGTADEACSAKASAFDYRIYGHAPKSLLTMARKLKAPAAESHGWGVPMASSAVRPAANRALKPPVFSAAAAAPSEGSMTEPTAVAAKAAASATPDTAAAVAQAVAEDRARRKSVLALPEAKGREPLAEHLMDSTTMSVEEIAATLKAAPAVAADAAPEESPQAHAARRAAAAGLAAPGGPTGADPAKKNLGLLADAVARANKRR